MANCEKSVFIGKKPERSVSPDRNVHISDQLHYYFTRRADILGPTNRTPEEDILLRTTCREVIDIRNKRAEEIASPEVRRAVKQARDFMHGDSEGAVKTFSCSDGRLEVPLNWGIPDAQRKSIENPGAFVPDTVKAKDGSHVFVEGSKFKKLVASVVARNDTTVQVIESHMGCAARKLKTEREKGIVPADQGLSLDVKEKKKLAGAFTSYQNEVNTLLPDDKKKRIIPIQTTYDPNTGFMYMGLEKKNVLGSVQEGEGFTVDTLKELAVNMDIISTELMLDGKVRDGSGRTIRNIFEEYRVKDFNWDTNYSATASRFWDNMTEMAEKTPLLETIDELVCWVFPEADAKERSYRTKLLGMNAYNAFHENVHKEHNESVIVISPGENGPYKKHNAFTISEEGKTLEKIISSIDIGEGLIRSNRVSGRVSKPEYCSLSDTRYASSAVPVFVKSEVREDILTSEWVKFDTLLKHDRKDQDPQYKKFIPDNWHEIESETFEKHIASFDIADGIKGALVRLHTGMRELSRTDTTLHDRVLSRRLELVPVIGDKDTGIKAVVPFIYEGYEPQAA